MKGMAMSRMMDFSYRFEGAADELDGREVDDYPMQSVIGQPFVRLRW